MAGIKQVKPSVFGDTRGAEIQVRHPGMPTGDGGIGRALHGLAGGIFRMGAGIIQVKEEEENLALEQAQADYLQEVTGGLDKEVFSLHGASLAGAEEKAQKILSGAEAKQLEKLSKYGARASEKFRIFATRSSTGYLSRTNHYAQGELRRATGEAAQATHRSSMHTYSLSGDEVSLTTYMDSFDTGYRVANGRIMSDEKLARLTEDVSKGHVEFRGEKLRIVDEVKEGDKGVIGRGAAEDLLSRMEKENAAYRQARQSALDTLHASRINQLLKWNDVLGAEAYLAGKAKQEGFSMSDRASVAMQEVVHQHRQLLAADLEAGDLVAGLDKDFADKYPGSLGGTLYSPEYERAGLSALEKLRKKALVDPTGNDTRKYNAALQKFQQSLQQKRAATRAEAERIQNYLTGGNPGKVNFYEAGNEGALIAEISELKDSFVKDRFMRDAIQRQKVRDAKLAATPEAQRLRRSVILEFSRLVSDGKKYQITDPKDPKTVLREFDLSTEKGVVEAMRYRGFSEQEMLEVLESRNNPYPLGVLTQKMADALNDIMQVKEGDARRFTPQMMSLLAPGLVTKLARTLAYDVRTADALRTRGKLSREEDKRVSAAVRSILQSIEVSEPGVLGSLRKVSLAEFMYRGVSDEGRSDTAYSYDKFCSYAMTQEQLLAVERELQTYRLSVNPRKEKETNPDMVKSRRDPLTVHATPTAKLRGRYYDPETGRYYRAKELKRLREERRAEKDRRARQEEILRNYTPDLTPVIDIGVLNYGL